MASIGLSYEIDPYMLTVYADFGGFDYYYDPETPEEFFSLVYTYEWNDVHYTDPGLSPHTYPGTYDPLQFGVEVDGSYRLEISAEESWTHVSATVVRNFVIATHATEDGQSVMGTAGDDVLFASGYADDAALGAGNDLAMMGDGDDVVLAGAGADTIYGEAGADTVFGGKGDDSVVIDELGDELIERAGEGTDTVFSPISFSDDNRLWKNVENLSLTGSANLDATGNGLNNWLVGTLGDNNLRGLAGDDTLDGHGGADRLEGGTGDDTYLADADDQVVERAGGGIDLLKTAGSYSLAGTQIEKLTLIAILDVDATGNALDNTLTGNSGANVLNGGVGADTIVGGGGKDRILGGAGNDLLTGGDGVDRFVFGSALSVGTNVDTILDFSSVQHDKILLDNDFFAALGTQTSTTALPSGRFSGDGAAHDANDYILYNPSTGELAYDSDGSGTGAAATVFAIIGTGTHPVLAYTDFQVIA